MEHRETTANIYGATDVGQVRAHNEDNFLIIDSFAAKNGDSQKDTGILFMVADGMGGSNAGEVASSIACEVVNDLFSKLQIIPASHYEIQKYLKNLLQAAHQQIIKHATEHPECAGMGTTAVLGWIVEDYLHVAWCGDSRCYSYLLNQEEHLRPLTDDHSLVWQMVLSGEINAEQARVHEHSNIILQSLGSTDSTPAPSYLNKKLSEGERILLCSDGLNGMLSDPQIQNLLDQQTDLQQLTNRLIKAANAAGGTDNITAICVEVKKISNSTAAPAKKTVLSPYLKSLFLVIAGALITILVYSFISYKKDANTITEAASTPPKPESKEIAHVESYKPVERKKNTDSGKPEKKKKEEATTNQKSTDTNGDKQIVVPTPQIKFDYQGELKRIKERLDELITVNNSKNDSTPREYLKELRNINSIIDKTQKYIDKQLLIAQENGQDYTYNEEELKTICELTDVSYTLNTQISQDSKSIDSNKQKIGDTLQDIVAKIDTKLKNIPKIKTPQRINEL